MEMGLEVVYRKQRSAYPSEVINMTDPLWILVIASMCTGTLLGISLAVVGLRLWRLGKAAIIRIDADGRTIKISYERPKLGTLPGKDRTEILDGRAKHGGKRAAWLIDAKTGWNYVAPTRGETFDAKLGYAVLEPSNPKTYHKALHRQRWPDIIRAGEDPQKNSVYVALGILALVALLILIGAVLYLVDKMNKFNATPGA